MKTLMEGLLEPTEMGYSLESQDRLWLVFTYDDESEDEFRGERLFLLDSPELQGGARRVWGYEALDDRNIVYTRRQEAEQAAEELRQEFASEAEKHGHFPVPEVFVINLGDDARWERAYLGRRTLLERGKFAGSTAALAEINRRYRERWEDEDA